jgi:spermidine/putrescine transport system permease protein
VAQPSIPASPITAGATVMAPAVPSSDAAIAGTPRRATRTAWLLLTPMVAWLVAFVVLPTGILLAYSFATSAGQARVEARFSLEGYRQIAESKQHYILEDGRLRERPWQQWVFRGAPVAALWRSVWFAVVTTVACVVMGYPVAYFMGRAAERWRNVLLLLVMIPFWTSFLVRTYAWIRILGPEGLLNTLLIQANVIAEPLDILYTPKAELIGLIYSFLPFMILPIYGSVEKLDGSLIDAAFDLGAGPVRAFRHVILPLTMPGIVAGVLLVFIPAVGMFAVSDVLGGKRVPMIGNVIEQQFVGKGGDWPYGAALGMTLLAMFIVVYALAARRGARAEPAI